MTVHNTSPLRDLGTRLFEAGTVLLLLYREYRITKDLTAVHAHRRKQVSFHVPSPEPLRRPSPFRGVSRGLATTGVLPWWHRWPPRLCFVGKYRKRRGHTGVGALRYRHSLNVCRLDIPGFAEEARNYGGGARLAGTRGRGEEEGRRSQVLSSLPQSQSLSQDH